MPLLTQSTTLVFDVLGLTPAQRLEYYRTLTVDQFTGLLACVRRDLGTPYALWQDDPVGFIEQILGQFMLEKQKEIARSVESNVRTVVPASHEVGKTWTAAMLVAWFVCVHRAMDTQVVTTAPRMRQVKTLLWPHIHAVHAAAGLPGDVDLVQWKMPDRKSPVAYGFAASDYDEDAVQGIHAEHLLIVVDEGGGIGHTMGKSLESITGGAHTRLLVPGNPPTDEEGSWLEERTKSEIWNTIRISWEDSPNYVRRDEAGEIVERSTEEVPDKVRRNLVDEQWVKDVITEFGEDSNYVEARVHARFPKGSTNKTIPWGWIEAALDNDNPEPSTWVRLGVDPAADGGDELAIALAVGNVVRIVHASSGAQNANPADVAGKILEQIREAEQIRQRLGETRRVRVKIDSLGVGQGAWGFLHNWGLEQVHDAEIVEVKVSESANDDKKYANKRAEMWWAGREMIRPRPADPERGMLARPPIVRLDLEANRRAASQLNAPKYGNDSQGRIRIEKKEEVKKRLGGSPDRGEAILLALYEPEVSEPARSNAGLLLGRTN